MVGVRLWLVVGLLVVLGGTAVADCAGPGTTNAGSTPPTTTAQRVGVLGPVYASPRPCRPVVPPGTYSSAELAATRDQVERATSGQFLRLGVGASTVEVGLLAGREALAARITQTFGSKVSITVGLTDYCGKPGRSPVCSPMPVGDPLPSGLTLRLVLKHGTMKMGDFGNATLVVHEDGPGTFQMDTGQPLVAQVVRSGTRRLVGAFSGGIGGTGYGPKIGAGQDEKIPVVFGTARCDGGLGSATPPGRYDVVVYMHPESPGGGPVYYSPPVPVVVTR